MKKPKNVAELARPPEKARQVPTPLKILVARESPNLLKILVARESPLKILVANLLKNIGSTGILIGPRGPKGPTGATGPTGAHNNDTIHKVRKISYHLGKLKNFFNHHINVADSLFDEPDEKDYSTLPKEVLTKKLSLLGGASNTQQRQAQSELL